VARKARGVHPIIRHGHAAALRREPCAGAYVSRRNAAACRSTPTLERMASSPHNSSSVLILALIAYSIYEHGYEGGTASRVDVRLRPRSCTLEDNGRGVGLHRDGYVVGLVEQLTSKQHRVAIHGLGLALAAMSAPLMVIESRRDGHRYVQRFEWGAARGGVEREDWNGASGTCIQITFASDAPEIEMAVVEDQVHQWRIGHPGLEIQVTRGAEHVL
jgi:DNA gyrase/topoisomerase IV subunit B